MNIIKLIIITLLSILNLFLLNKDYRKGLAFSIFLLILMPRELFFEVGGGLPTLTGFRAIILTALFYSLYTNKLKIKWQKMPILTLLILVLFCKACSLFFAYDLMVSFNGILIFLIERLLFFVILIKGIENRETLESILRSVGLVIIIIAILGFIERYTQINPVDYIALSDNPRFESRMANEVYSTLPHPILFGTALAMGLPICLFLFDVQANRTVRYIIGIFVLLIIAAIYFSNSRGPWLACIVVFFILLLLNYSRIRVRVIPMLYLTILVLMLRPGVFDTIYGLSASTLDENSLEGSSFQYRFELFKVAYREIILAPERLAFGYGDNAAQSMNITGMLSYGSRREVTFWSWDSEFALLLLHNGFIGFALHLILYLYCLIYLMKKTQLVDGKDRDLIIALLASNSVLVFMMTNVAIFAPQLHFIFWTNMAIGAVISGEKYQMLTDEEG